MREENNTFKFPGKFRKPIYACVLAIASAAMAFGQDGEALFKQNCGVCHRVGGGKMVGPDLMGVTQKRSEEWLLKWTKGSTALINSGDPDAKAIFSEFGGMIMPDQAHLSDADVKAIYAFISSKSGAPANASTDTAKKETVVADISGSAGPAEIQKGKNLFVGSMRMAGGGPSCISCHNVNYNGVIPGGLLAKDLTNTYSRLGGDAGLLGILGAPPFPAMTQAYKDKPLQPDEVAAIIAFLNKVDKDTANRPASVTNPLLYGGAAGLVFLLLLILFTWYRRKLNTVKKEIYNRQIKSI